MWFSIALIQLGQGPLLFFILSEASKHRPSQKQVSVQRALVSRCCLVHTPVLAAADQIKDGISIFFPLRLSGTSLGSCLQQRKQLEHHVIISLPFWEWYLFALLWYLPFYFLPPLLLPISKG